MTNNVENVQDEKVGHKEKEEIVKVKRARNISPGNNRNMSPNTKYPKFTTGLKKGGFDPGKVST